MPPRFNNVEMRSLKYAARQYVSETHDHKPDAPSHHTKVMVLDEGIAVKRPPAAIWLPLTGGQCLKIVRDQRVHMDERIFRVELYDGQRVNRLAVFRRSTETTRR
jgi:hypothetical protein